MESKKMLFIAARWFAKGEATRARDLIVLHSMEAADKPDTAAAVGKYFAQLPASNKASAHVGADSAELVGYVHDDDVAYGAPNANHNGLHLEQTGYAAYTRGQWTQPDMMLMLQQSAQQVRAWASRYNIPLVFLDAAALKRGERGVTTHAEVDKAWPSTGHTDPGINYPINTLLAMASAKPEVIAQHMEDNDVYPYFMVNNPNGPGYWTVKRSDGGVFAYGPNGETSGASVAPFFGSMAGKSLAAPIMALTPWVENGKTVGYLLTGADGGVFAFGAAPFTDNYVGHPEWHKGDRTFVGALQHDSGYIMCSIEEGSDPPKMQQYDLTVKR